MASMPFPFTLLSFALWGGIGMDARIKSGHDGSDFG